MSIKISNGNNDFISINNEDKLILNIFDDDSNIIILNNSNIINGDVLINFNNNFVSGIKNNKYVIKSNSNDFDIFDIDENNINLYNTNITNNSFTIFNNISIPIFNLNLNSYVSTDFINFNLNHDNAEFKIISKNDYNDVILNISTNQTYINNDLYINSNNTIWANKIKNYDNNKLILENVELQNLEQGSIILNNTSIGQDSSSTLKLKQDDLNLNNFIETNTSDETINFSINNNGLVNIGSGINVDNSYLYLSKINNDNIIDSINIIEFEGEEQGDSFKLTKYANLGIGTKFPQGMLHIDRKDDRVDQDIRTKPLLKMNIDFDDINNNSNYFINKNSFFNSNLSIKILRNLNNYYIITTDMFNDINGDILKINNDIIYNMNSIVFSGITIYYPANYIINSNIYSIKLIEDGVNTNRFFLLDNNESIPADVSLFYTHSVEDFDIYVSNNFSNRKILYEKLLVDTYKKPDFFYFTSNNTFISSFSSTGVLSIGENIPDNLENIYSIYINKNKSLINNIETNTISSLYDNNNNEISFSDNKLININTINSTSNINNIIYSDEAYITKIYNYDLKLLNLDDSTILHIFNNTITYYSTINFDFTSLSSIIPASLDFFKFTDAIHILSNDSNKNPSITIYGNNENDPLYILKKHKGSTSPSDDLYYYNTITSRNFYINGSYTNNVDIYEINYFNNNIKNLSQTHTSYFNDNSTHILQHINDYNLITFGENYNIVIDNNINLQNDSQTLQTNASLNKISIGVPHKSPHITITDGSSIMYNYNTFPVYFKDYIASTASSPSDYMLNIFGNVKIGGIDGNSSAFTIKIDDSTYKTNIGIGCEPNIDDSNNTLKIDGNCDVNGELKLKTIKLYNPDLIPPAYVDITNAFKNAINSFIADDSKFII